MRLIDADKLKEEIRENDPFGGMNYEWYIDHAPTIDTASPWHRVEDELPPPNKTVLVCKIWRDVNGEPHKVITMDSFTISPSDSVIAWMPLPEPPKEETP